MLTSDSLKYYQNTRLRGIIKGDKTIYTMIGLDDHSIYIEGRLKPIPINSFVPIMRNLDELIEPNRYNTNESVIPIFELAKLSDSNFYPNQKYLTKLEFDGDQNDYGKTIYICGWEDKNGNEYKFFYSKDKQSFYSSKMGCNELPQILPNQLKLFNALYMWHFWVGCDKYFENNFIINMKNL